MRPALTAPGPTKAALAAGASLRSIAAAYNGRLRRKRAHAYDEVIRTAAATAWRRRIPDAALDADAARREAAAARDCASNQADGRRGPQGRRHVAG